MIAPFSVNVIFYHDIDKRVPIYFDTATELIYILCSLEFRLTVIIVFDMRCEKVILVVISIIVLGYTGSGSIGVLGGVILENKSSLPRCPVANPIAIGYIKEPELVEASGLVASRHYHGIYYSIQDSKNPDNVYALNYAGYTVGNVTQIERFNLIQR